MDWRQYAMSFWNEYQAMMNMQLAMYQILANNQSSLRIRSIEQTNQHQRTLKRLTHKRERNILTKEKNNNNNNTSENVSISLNDYEEIESRPITSEIMTDYLAKRCHRTVTICHAKVAQKSYGNEKRFFCPPPCIYLSGDGWTVDSTKSSFHSQESLSAKIGIHSCNEMQHLSIDHHENMKYASAKTLFISDSDKRKYINLTIKLISEDQSLIGVFESQKMKIISKPSKKKQSIKNAESVCIQSGTKIALFNRLRSQNVSTRFLHVNENNQFYASAQQWGSFYIYLIDKESKDCLENEEFLHYGATVKLVCSKTDQSLPDFIIRKVDKNRVFLDSDEPVSQLHKCAFEFKDNSGEFGYLSLANERLIGTSGKPCPTESFRMDVNDSACWTIISTDKAEYSWYEAQGPVSHPITPIPIADNLITENEDDRSMIEITGENLTSYLSVWFGDIESPYTEYRSTQSILAEIPKSSSLISIDKPISLVRRDGIIYPTSLIFSFSSSSSDNL